MRKREPPKWRVGRELEFDWDPQIVSMGAWGYLDWIDAEELLDDIGRTIAKVRAVGATTAWWQSADPVLAERDGEDQLDAFYAKFFTDEANIDRSVTIWGQPAMKHSDVLRVFHAKGRHQRGGISRDERDGVFSKWLDRVLEHRDGVSLDRMKYVLDRWPKEAPVFDVLQVFPPDMETGKFKMLNRFTGFIQNNRRLPTKEFLREAELPGKAGLEYRDEVRRVDANMAELGLGGLRAS